MEENCKSCVYGQLRCHTVLCRRYPKYEVKNWDDYCGEYKVIETIKQWVQVDNSKLIEEVKTPGKFIKQPIKRRGRPKKAKKND